VELTKISSKQQYQNLYIFTFTANLMLTLIILSNNWKSIVFPRLWGVVSGSGCGEMLLAGNIFSTNTLLLALHFLYC